MNTMTIQDVQRELGVGRTLAERYVRQSGAALPRAKREKYVIDREKFLAWFRGGIK